MPYPPPPSRRADHREVLDVEGDHHPSLLRSELEQPLVLKAVELALLIGRADIVPALTQRAGDPRPRDVRVKEQPQRAPHAAPLTAMNGYSSQLLKRTTVGRNRRVDLLSEPLGIGDREPDLPLACRPLRSHWGAVKEPGTK